jgi:hypothetical protein
MPIQRKLSEISGRADDDAIRTEKQTVGTSRQCRGRPVQKAGASSAELPSEQPRGKPLKIVTPPTDHRDLRGRY